MPFSSDYAIGRVVWVARNLRPHRILDVGCGSGKYGALFRLILDGEKGQTDTENTTIDGIDGYLPTRNRCHEAYDNITVGNASELMQSNGPNYDLVFLGDIIEHFEKRDGLDFLHRSLERAAMGVLVTTPRHFIEQGAFGGNEFERHRSLWTRTDFDAYPFSKTWVEYRQAVVGLISKTSIDMTDWPPFHARPWISSFLERASFSTLGFNNSRLLKARLTGNAVERPG